MNMPKGLSRHEKAVWFLKNVSGVVQMKIQYLKERKGYTDDEIMNALNGAADNELLKTALPELF